MQQLYHSDKSQCIERIKREEVSKIYLFNYDQSFDACGINRLLVIDELILSALFANQHEKKKSLRYMPTFGALFLENMKFSSKTRVFC